MEPVENMSALAALALLASIVTPFITALFTKPDMQASTKRLIAAGVAIVLGIVTAIVTGQFSWASEDLVQSVTTALVTAGVVMALAQGFYSQFKDAVKGIEDAAHPGIEPEPDVTEPNYPEPTQLPAPVPTQLPAERGPPEDLLDTDPTEGEPPRPPLYQ